VFSVQWSLSFYGFFTNKQKASSSLEWKNPYRLENLKVPCLKPGTLFLLLWHGQ
jgi:hypothetical protein